MSYRLLNVEKVENGLAERLLKEHEEKKEVPGERIKKKKRVSNIKTLCRDGEFNRCDWAYCHCLENDTWYRVNGQHTGFVLRAILDGDDDDLDGVEFPAGVPLVITTYECDTAVDLANVFDQFDRPMSVRSPDDKLGVYMAQYADLVGIDKKLCANILAGIAWGARRVETIKELCGGLEFSTAYDRGSLLSLDVIRDFIDVMSEYSGAPFKEWQQKTGIITKIFDVFLSDREDAELLVEQMMFEVGDLASGFTSDIRKLCSKSGKDQGFFYRKTDKYARSQLKYYDANGRDSIKKLIREVLSEDEVEETELCEAV